MFHEYIVNHVNHFSLDLPISTKQPTFEADGNVISFADTWWITKVITVNPVDDMNVCIRIHFYSFWDIFLKTKIVSLMLAPE